MSWWVLVKSSESPIPHAMGPYPSRELCRIAARHVMPGDQRFWTPDEREAEAERERERERVRAEKIEAARASFKGKEGWVSIGDGTSVYFDADGNQTRMAASGYSVVGPWFTALSDCVEIPEAK